MKSINREQYYSLAAFLTTLNTFGITESWSICHGALPENNKEYIVTLNGYVEAVYRIGAEYESW